MNITAVIYQEVTETFGDVGEVSDIEQVVDRSLFNFFNACPDSFFVVEVLPRIVGSVTTNEEKILEIIEKLYQEYGPKQEVRPPKIKKRLKPAEYRTVDDMVARAIAQLAAYGNYIRAKAAQDKTVFPEEDVVTALGPFLDGLIEWQSSCNVASGKAEVDDFDEYERCGRTIITEFERLLDQQISG